ncbi:MAG: M16 family metallopeptidase [Chloroflexota bacterium]|nr:MAG: peptidase M16 [Chloroflexota bacterium]
MMATTLTRQDSRFYIHTLPNGLQMLGQLIPGMQSAAAVFWVCTGTRDEQQEQMGVSHFLEHMAFRRTQRIGGKVDRLFEEMGADHNAATWLEMTFYWARVLAENVDKAIDVLTDLTRPVLDAEDFDQERNVILEEIARYEDIPTHVLLSHFMWDFFGDHPLAWETLGTSGSIRELRVEQMRDYWARRYGSRNVIFAIAGNFDWDAVVAQVEMLTSDWKPGETGRTALPASFRPASHVYHVPKFTQEQIAIGTPTVARDDPRYFASAVLATILGDDTGSRLYWALYHTGLAESASAQPMQFEDNGLLLVHIATEPGKAAKALDAVRSELDRLQSFDVSDDELARAKAKLTSSVIIGGESTNDRMMSLIRSWLSRGKLETLEELRHEIESVTIEDLRALVHSYPVSPDQVITAVGPLPDGELQAAG